MRKDRDKEHSVKLIERKVDRLDILPIRDCDWETGMKKGYICMYSFVRAYRACQKKHTHIKNHYSQFVRLLSIQKSYTHTPQPSKYMPTTSLTIK